MGLDMAAVRTDIHVDAQASCFAVKNGTGGFALYIRLREAGRAELLIGCLPDLTDVAVRHYTVPPIRSKGLRAWEEEPTAKWT